MSREERDRILRQSGSNVECEGGEVPGKTTPGDDRKGAPGTPGT